MAQKASKSGPMRRFLFFLKWSVLPLALVTILPLAALTVYEMNRGVAIPEVVQRLESERVSTELPQNIASPTETSPTQEAGEPQMILTGEEADVSEIHFEPLIPESEDLPDDADVDELRKLNEAFEEMERAIAEYGSGKENYSYQEASNLIFSLYPKALNLRVSVQRSQHVGPFCKSPEGRLVGNAATERINDFRRELDLAVVELFARHEIWQGAAIYSTEWDDKVYFYRRCGPAHGTAFIAKEISERSLNKISYGIESFFESLWPDQQQRR
jgi:hypothetical protein